MAIKIKGDDGDLTGVSRKQRKLDAEKMGKTAAARAAQIKYRSEGGFRGEDKNEYGLPKGGSMMVQDDAYASKSGEPAPKFRRGKTYAEGTKGIQIKRRGEANDATSTKSPLKKELYGDRLSKMNTKQLDAEVDKQLNNEKFDYTKMSSGPKYSQAMDSLVYRKNKGKYSMGTSSIKMKPKRG